MAVRTGMSDLITMLRGMVAAGTADFTAGGVTWWSDQQLQDALDQYARTVIYKPLTPVWEYAGGTLVNYEFRAYLQNIEGTASGVPYFHLVTGAGSPVSGTYTLDIWRGIIRFTTDQAGSAFLLRGRSYNLNAAAADIWQIKTGQVAGLANIEPGLMSVWGVNCQMQAKAFRRLAGITVSVFARTDENS